jgi:hypothetical protein
LFIWEFVPIVWAWRQPASIAPINPKASLVLFMFQLVLETVGELSPFKRHCHATSPVLSQFNLHQLQCCCFSKTVSAEAINGKLFGHLAPANELALTADSCEKIRSTGNGSQLAKNFSLRRFWFAFAMGRQ